MTLQEFFDMWTRKNLTVIICRERYFDDMFETIDDINDGKVEFDCNTIVDYAICAIIPHFTQFAENYFLKPEIVNATVENFFIYEDKMIVWIGGEEDL